MKMPYLRAIRATLNSLKASTDLWIVTSEYTVEAHGLCSDLVSHRTIEFDTGEPALGHSVKLLWKEVKRLTHYLVFQNTGEFAGWGDESAVSDILSDFAGTPLVVLTPLEE